ncbi:MAG: hypothetical protein SGPRY_010681, partial [Prymnesium sp.]
MAQLTAIYSSRKRKADESEGVSLREALAAKQAKSKFKPLTTIPDALHPVNEARGVVPSGSSILIIQRPWIDLILNGQKTLEIRGKPCKKQRERIYLALSGGGGIILGSVKF